MALKIDAKFEGKLTCDFQNDMGNLANFHQSTWKSQNWDFDGMLLLSLKFKEELCVMTMKNDAKFGEELTCCFKIEELDKF